MDSSVVIAAILLAVTVILVGIGIFNSIRSNRKNSRLKADRNRMITLGHTLNQPLNRIIITASM
jgi:hypothetical protein